MNISTVAAKSPLFPKRLRQIADPPKQLFVAGAELDGLLAAPCLAVVGSRAVTPYGQQVTQQLAGAAARAGITIISGLALGVDSLAHRAALEAGGRTIAVLPTGLGRIYPASHQRLAQQIIQQDGALVSEYADPVAPMKHQFIARNRLIAGLANRLLITEAAAGSGSLHTAQFALDDGKDVIIVPGDINRPSSAGANNLMLQGAEPILTVSQLLEKFQLKAVARRPKSTDPAQQKLLDLIGQGISQESQLLTKSQLPTSQFNQNLTMLEINGQIKPLGGGRWHLRTF